MSARQINKMILPLLQCENVHDIQYHSRRMGWKQFDTSSSVWTLDLGFGRPMEEWFSERGDQVTTFRLSKYCLVLLSRDR